MGPRSRPTSRSPATCSRRPTRCSRPSTCSSVDDGRGLRALEEELGDLLFQVVFHATLAAEEGRFTLADVARAMHDKLVLRHPHVFGDVEVDGADEVVANWEQIKKAEKGRDSVFDGIPAGLPALLYALKVEKKAVATGLADRVPLPEGDDLGAELLALGRRGPARPASTPRTPCGARPWPGATRCVPRNRRADRLEHPWGTRATPATGAPRT